MAENSGILYLSRADVERAALDMPAVLALLESAFREKAAGRIEMPPKPGIHTSHDSFIHAMPAYIPALAAAGVKWVSGYPDNASRGLPYISGLIVLNDVVTGIPYAVMDCTWVTAARTGAATALAAKHLARPDSETAGILGCGVQGRINLVALSGLFKLRRVFAHDTRQEAQQAFVHEMHEQLEIEVVGVDEPKAAVESSDLIVTAGPILLHPHETIREGWVRPGSFASAVDFDSYWSAGALSEFNRIATDDREQFACYEGLGYFQSTPRPDADLGELVAGLKPGRRGPEERTIAINLGIALEDMAVAPAVYRRAVEMGLGTRLPL